MLPFSLSKGVNSLWCMGNIVWFMNDRLKQRGLSSSLVSAFFISTIFYTYRRYTMDINMKKNGTELTVEVVGISNSGRTDGA